MDPSSDGAYSRTQNISSGRALEPRASVESQGPRLQKRSHPGVRNASQPQPRPGLASRAYGQGGSGSGGGEQARKSSLLNVVRKMFGRRSKEVKPQPQPQQRSPSKDTYHFSEPSALVPQVEEAEPDSQQDSIPHRTLSAPLQQLPPSFQRTRSPYAVEFPQSARLKPLQLGDPFYAPGSQLRRRKTLPSLVASDTQAAAIASALDESAMPSFEAPRDTPTPELLGRASTIKSAKRRSRSADDLRRALAKRSPPRKRSDEIRFWRASFQGSVLRASGFVSREPRDTSLDVRAEDRTPQARTEDPFGSRQSRAGTLRSSPPVRHGPTLSDADIRSASGYETELSRDLEDRVAKLEAGLQNFQQSLARLTAERNHRTVMVRGAPQRRLSTDARTRTPSMLADTLSNPLALASLRYDVQETERPSTSPRTPVRATSSRNPPVPPLPMTERTAVPFSTPPSPPATASIPADPPQPYSTSGASSDAPVHQPPQHTFRSLYEMLADERSARRRLESQLRNMHHEINDLHYQVSTVGSGVQSQRSSFNALDPMVGSSRLRELLRETEGSPPGTRTGTGLGTGNAEADSPQRVPARSSGATAFSTSTGTGGNLAGGVISRFSNSESEAGAMAGSREDLTTPYDAYQTPREERSTFPFSGGGASGEGEMF